MVGMFLLFLASTAVIDLYRELRFRTFDRYHTLHERLLPFMTGKLLFSVVVLALCSAILLGGGALIFRIRWPQPLAMLALTLAYCGFAAAFMAALAACVPDERRAAALNSIAGMILGIAGGCAFPPQQLPALVRDHITPLLPSFWYVDTLRNLQWNASVHWWPVVAELLLATLLLLGLAAALFRRRFQAGTVR
jgi:ABC-type multidrug transport system permease subunit